MESRVLFETCRYRVATVKVETVSNKFPRLVVRLESMHESFALWLETVLKTENVKRGNVRFTVFE
jgi:hypothetical protein